MEGQSPYTNGPLVNCAMGGISIIKPSQRTCLLLHYAMLGIPTCTYCAQGNNTYWCCKLFRFFFLNTQNRQEQFTILLCFQTKSTQKRQDVANLPFCFVFKQKTQKRRGVANLPFFFVFKHVRETRSSKLTVLLCVTTHKRPSSVVVHSSGSTPTCNCCTVLYSSRSLKNHQQKVNITPQLATTQTVHK